MQHNRSRALSKTGVSRTGSKLQPVAEDGSGHRLDPTPAQVTDLSKGHARGRNPSGQGGPETVIDPLLERVAEIVTSRGWKLTDESVLTDFDHIPDPQGLAGWRAGLVSRTPIEPRPYMPSYASYDIKHFDGLDLEKYVDDGGYIVVEGKKVDRLPLTALAKNAKDHDYHIWRLVKKHIAPGGGVSVKKD
ncbi:hypothetical protein BDV96DRAFT_605209 [Lophiotrema nucula]|uniref:Uncharacterized protein n=1 Tax=Lophiotrema nucula TaxID=690887 RepID=A0A6A5YRI0_9PLEO|nr:hypothetical protein BDV96DRAFT_605209 [Lophiotrema nucula]